jgi:urease accessory protein
MPRKTLIAAFLLIPTAAFAHTGAGTAFGFSDGFWHPLGGLDHLLAMFAVGLLAAQLGGNAVWLVPGTFIALMIAGALAGFFGAPLPGVEYGIGLSVVAIALPIAFAFGMPLPLAMALVGIFAIFHGHAHGAEVPEGANVVRYVFGFTLATALIHGAGVMAGFALARWNERQLFLRMSGGIIALMGIALLAVTW